MSLTLDEANRVIRGALAKAQELNIKISAAVCDSGGRLIALQRMDTSVQCSMARYSMIKEIEMSHSL